MAIQEQASLAIARAYAEKYPESQRLHQEAPRLAQLDFSNLQEDTATLLQGTPIAKALRKGMLLHGVDLMRVAGFVSAAHTPEIIAETVQAFDRTITRMQQEGLLT